jgi:hypothetical protein
MSDGQSLTVQQNGATTGPMNPMPPPADDDDSVDPKGITVRFPPDEMKDYELIADLWNAIDEATGVQRKVKWKPTSILRHAARELRKAVKKKLGEWPTDPAGREAFIRKVVAESSAPPLKKHEKPG